MSKQHLGHKLKVGDWFESQSNRMIKGVTQSTGTETLRYRVPGSTDFFQHRGRRYFCEVLGCIERRSGYYYGVWDHSPVHAGALDKRVRWYQFTYVVRILEN